MGWRDGSAVKG
jgi:hypothetical protein